MPRLTNMTYLATHDVLRRHWLEDQRDFTYLKGRDQSAVHAFYRPAYDLTDVELLAHRKAITLKHPSLPNRAGKALAVFSAVLSAAPPAISSSDSGRTISVRVVRRPHPDLAKFHAALMHYVLDHPELLDRSPDAAAPRAA